MVLHGLADRWAARLCTAAKRDDPYQQALTAYVIEGYLAVAYGAVLLLLAGWLVGAFWYTLAAAATAAFLKTFTGGAHLGTPTRCAMAGAAIYALIGLAAKHLAMRGIYPPLLWPVLAASNVLVWAYAPVETPEKPLGAKQRRILGLIARSVVGLQTLACIIWPHWTWQTSVCLGSAFQCFSLSRSSRRIVAALDGVFKTGRAGREVE